MRDAASILPLEVDNLTFEIEGKPLLASVRFSLPKGGITAVIGPNGAGKSLMLRLCHGLLVPSAGNIRWQAEDGVILGRKRHGMVFQRPVMLRRSTRANLAHALHATGARDVERKIKITLERFGLEDLADRPARLLSGGEQQRFAIARAWALEPELLFLDEPTSQLDPGATRQIEEIIAALAADGMTILLATHDLGQARRLSQRLFFLNRGQLVEDAASAAFFAAPSTPEGKAFIAGELLW
ncbi:MAG: ATP-binding cassette domain-containing protein [Beijerinckiaceae bacterium]